MKKILALVASGSSLLLPFLVKAQETIPDNTVLSGGLYGVRDLITTITNWLFVILLVLAVLFIILAAYRYMFSQGNDEAVAAAHKMLIYAVVAVAVAFLAKGIVFVVRQLVTGSNSGGSAVNGGGGGSGGNGTSIGGYYDSNGNWHVNIGISGGN